jgi:hypothetical protein
MPNLFFLCRLKINHDTNEFIFEFGTVANKYSAYAYKIVAKFLCLVAFHSNNVTNGLYSPQCIHIVHCIPIGMVYFLKSFNIRTNSAEANNFTDLNYINIIFLPNIYKLNGSCQ